MTQENLVYWMGKDIRQMSRDELEEALRVAASINRNLMEENTKRARLYGEMMRLGSMPA
ncbi:MAG: hypothetical protein WC100_05810 [Sterolibacterium sp.]